MSKKQNKPITIMVSSTVYGSEDVLDRVYDLLTSFGYEVWMSHKGTLPVFSKQSAFENCLEGVRRALVMALGLKNRIQIRYPSFTKSCDLLLNSRKLDGFLRMRIF